METKTYIPGNLSERFHFKDIIKIQFVNHLIKYNSVTLEQLSIEFKELPLCLIVNILDEMLLDKSLDVIPLSSPRAFKLKMGDGFLNNKI